VFGDSLVDNGNNNDIASLARANYPPYGIDFPNGATGRFSNGLTTVDAICKIEFQAPPLALPVFLSCCVINYLLIMACVVFTTLQKLQGVAQTCGSSSVASIIS
jgi:hypothetical protein